VTIFFASGRFDHRKPKKTKATKRPRHWRGSWSRLPNKAPRNFWLEIRRSLNPFTRDPEPRKFAPVPHWVSRGNYGDFIYGDFIKAMREYEEAFAKPVAPFGFTVGHTIESDMLDRAPMARFVATHYQPRQRFVKAAPVAIASSRDPVPLQIVETEAKVLRTQFVIPFRDWQEFGVTGPFEIKYMAQRILSDAAFAMAGATA